MTYAQLQSELPSETTYETTGNLSVASYTSSETYQNEFNNKIKIPVRVFKLGNKNAEIAAKDLLDNLKYDGYDVVTKTFK